MALFICDGVRNGTAEFVVCTHAPLTAFVEKCLDLFLAQAPAPAHDGDEHRRDLVLTIHELGMGVQGVYMEYTRSILLRLPVASYDFLLLLASPARG